MSIPIDVFPLDGNRWYVLRYGDVLSNPTHNTTATLLQITLKCIETKEKREVAVPLTEITYIRLGSIWKDQSYTKRYYRENLRNFFNNKFLKFDLKDHPPETVIFVRTPSGEKETVTVTLETDLSQYANRIGGAYVLLETNDGISVYISASELFSTTYAPYLKSLREKILTHPIHEVLRHFVETCRKNDDEYFLQPKRMHYDETIALLAYLSCNKISRARASLIHSSLMRNHGLENDLGKASCLFVVPYHPTRFAFEGSGFWKDSKTIYIQRINMPYIPDDYPINYAPPRFRDNETTEEDEENTASMVANKKTVNNTVRFQNDFSPSNLQGIKNVDSDIHPNKGDAIIRRLEGEEYSKRSRDLPNEELDDPEYAGAGRPANTKDSHKTARVQNQKKKEEVRYDDAALKRLIEILKEMELEGEIRLNYVGENGSLYTEPVYFSRYDASKKREGLYLIQVEKEGKIHYLLETDRRTPSAKFSGVYFAGVTVNQELREAIIDFMSEINHHIPRKKKEEKSSKNYITFPVSNYKVYRHSQKESSMQKMLLEFFQTEKKVR